VHKWAKERFAKSFAAFGYPFSALGSGFSSRV